MSRVQRAALEVQRYWGTHLHVEVVADATPCMDWKKVLMPPEAEAWSEDQLLTTLHHEWGHRMISPISPARGALWRLLAEARAGLDAHQARLLVNIVTDLWIDRSNLESRELGGVYTCGLSESVTQLDAAIRGSTGGIGSGDDAEPGGIAPFLLAFYERLLRECGRPGESRSREARASEEEEYGGLVDAIWTVVYDHARSEADRIVETGRLMGPHLPHGNPVVLYRIMHPFRGDEINGTPLSRANLREVEDAGLAGGLRNPVLMKEAEALQRRTERLRMYARVAPSVERFLLSRRSGRREGYRIWHPGKPTPLLQAVASMERAAIMLPGVTTLAVRTGPPGGTLLQRAGRVVIVLDDSGSTTGAVLLREKEAAFAVTGAARHMGDPVGFVAFGSAVSARCEPTTHWHRVEDLVLSLNSGSGGTDLQPALETALAMLGPRGAGTILLMTDALVSDARATQEFVRRLPGSCRLVAFCFTDVEQAARLFPGSPADRVRVLAASPETPFAEQALEEIHG